MPRPVAANSYDAVPYPTYALPQTHPRRLETIAWLLSLSAPSSQNCRVLELGCGDGGNLIPMAVASPQCQFVGMDASAVQIDKGRQQIADLGLANIQLEQRAIEQLDATVGSFDYILCHGVFSWVPQRVQMAILRLVRGLLTANGVAYISYNTQPGWHGRGAIRNMMGYHVGRFADDSPHQRIRRARQLLDFLTRATAVKHDSYGLLLRENLNLLKQLPDAYLFHEHLEEFNEPIWFLDFCEMLSGMGLRYLGEADFAAMIVPPDLSDEVRSELDELAPHLLEKEQYLDFLRNRSFRQTLVCHAGCRPNYAVRSERIQELYIGSPLVPKSPSVDYSPGLAQEFDFRSDTTLTTQLAIFKAALVVLNKAWPSLLPFRRLLQEATELLHQVGIADQDGQAGTALAQALLTTYSSTSQSIIELARQPIQFSREVSATPVASPLARLQARTSPIVSNLRHESVQLSEAEGYLIAQLDGTHSLEDVLPGLMERFPQLLNESVPATDQTPNSQEVISKQEPIELGRQILTGRLRRLAQYALLVG